MVFSNNVIVSFMFGEDVNDADIDETKDILIKYDREELSLCPSSSGSCGDAQTLVQSVLSLLPS